MPACVTRPGSYDDKGDVAGMLVARVGVFTGFAPTPSFLEKSGGRRRFRPDASIGRHGRTRTCCTSEGTAFDASHPLCVTFEAIKRTQVSRRRRATHVVAHYYRPSTCRGASGAGARTRATTEASSAVATGTSSVTVGGIAATEFDRPVSGAPGGAFDSFGVFGSGLRRRRGSLFVLGSALPSEESERFAFDG